MARLVSMMITCQFVRSERAKRPDSSRPLGADMRARFFSSMFLPPSRVSLRPTRLASDLTGAELVAVRQATSGCLTAEQYTVVRYRWLRAHQCRCVRSRPMIDATIQRRIVNVRKTTAFLNTEVSMWIQVLLSNFADAIAGSGSADAGKRATRKLTDKNG